MKLITILEAIDPRSKIRTSAIKYPVYHGTTGTFTKFKRPPSGVFFTPHKDWAEEYYGADIITCYLDVPKLYVLNWGKQEDVPILEALFDRDYDTLAMYIPELQQQGYAAMQTTSDSEMICAFSNANIYSASTGKLM